MSQHQQQQQVRYPAPPPKGTWRRSIWQKWVRFESSTALSMLEPWERIACLIFALLITTLFWASLLTLYPRYISYLSRRFSYYVFDDETVSTRDVVREWIRSTAVKGLAGIGIGIGSGAGGGAGESGLASAVGQGLKRDL